MSAPPEFDSLLDAVPVLIWTAHEDGSVDYVNARWTGYTGLPAAEGLGWNWLSIVHPDDAARCNDVWEVAIAGRTALELQLRFRRSDGLYRWHLVRAIPVVEGEGMRWIGSSFDIDRQKRIERALEFLAKANDVLSASLDLRTTVETLTDLCVPEVADCCAVHLNDNGHPVLASVKYADPARAQSARESFAVIRSSIEPPLTEVLRSGKPLVAQERHRALREALGLREAAIFPMTSAQSVVGTLALGMAESGRSFSGLDVQFGTLLANRAAMGVANAALFEREHRAANVLQRALLPSALPKIDGFRLEACYVTAESMRNVGGDWYDAFTIGDDRVLLSIGDVSGKGLAAATTMGRVRDSLRAAALCNDDPVRIVEIADEALRDESNPFVTCFVGVLERRRNVLRYTSAGHHAPRLRAPDGGVSELTACGLPLGLLWAGRAVRTSGEVVLEPGALLVLFTDGLIEQTRRPLTELARLHDVISALPSSGTAAALRDAFVVPPSVDDVAILTLSVNR